MVRLLLILFLCIPAGLFSQSTFPAPDHIVIVIMENKSYSQIIGSADAPTINSLANSSNTALFTQSYAITYPSQPNYLCLFSGCNQGVVDNAPPQSTPFTSANLGRQLIDAGKTFITYAEDLPHVGYEGEISGNYVRRHNPAVYWIGNGPNQLPASVIQPFTAFPGDFDSLPTVSFVIPNNISNMHDGAIAQGDQWIETHLSAYIQWAKTHNSLFILTFDEDNKSEENRITTIFSGEMIKMGSYSQLINHYNILRTIEDLYGLPYACNASTAKPITGCWEIHGRPSLKDTDELIAVYANSNHKSITVAILKDSLVQDIKLSVMNIHGAKLKEVEVLSSRSIVHLNEFSAGVYIFQVMKNKKILQRGKIVIN